MNKQADNIQKNRSLAVASKATSNRRGNDSTFEFKDKSQETVTLENFQLMANNSRQAKHLLAIQRMCDSCNRSTDDTEYSPKAEKNFLPKTGQLAIQKAGKVTPYIYHNGNRINNDNRELGPPVFKNGGITIQKKPNSIDEVIPDNGLPTGDVIQACGFFSWLFGSCMPNNEEEESMGEDELALIERAEREPVKLGKCVTIPQGDYKEVHDGEYAWFQQITSCTAVYIRCGSKVVIYHWPFTALTEGSKEDFNKAVELAGGKDSIDLIRLYTKSDSDLAEFIEYLKGYTQNIKTDMVDYQTEPMVNYDGSRLI